jgi:hypothetical protein
VVLAMTSTVSEYTMNETKFRIFNEMEFAAQRIITLQRCRDLQAETDRLCASVTALGLRSKPSEFRKLFYELDDELSPKDEKLI